MWKLVSALKDEMGDAYPELVRAQALLEETLRAEEERFQRTLGRGMSLLNDATEQLGEGDILSGQTAFKLYDTYGFPLDLTQDALRSKGMKVDEAGFNAAMEKQRADARASQFSSGQEAPEAVWFDVRAKTGASEFVGYDGTDGVSKLVAIVSDGVEVKAVEEGQRAELIFAATPFYGESGGQAGDTGMIEFSCGAVFRVEDTKKRGGDLHAHIGVMEKAEVTLGDEARLIVDAYQRNESRANHSATHLAHAALRSVLGPHVAQKGSYVGPDRLRFDFSHNKAITADEISAIEAQVNAVIRQNLAVSTREMTPEAAIEAGALALFGEKYGDEVRVLSMGSSLNEADKPYSVELCGGTHVTRTGDIALFKIIAESAVASGVRRVEGLTGEAARLWMEEQMNHARQTADALKVPPAKLPERVKVLSDDRKKLERQLAEAKKKLAMGGGSSAAPVGPEEIAGIKFSGRVVEGVGGRDLRGLVDDAKASLGSGVVAFIGVMEGKASLAVGVSDDLKSKISAVDLVKAGSVAVGGKGGGGRPDFAQAGGPDGAKAEAGLEAIKAELAQ